MAHQIAINIKKLFKIRLQCYALLSLAFFLISCDQKNESVVFMGDSITELWKVNDPSFFSEHPFINKGISGQTTQQMLLRFDQDVIRLHPATVILLAGTNDIAENVKGSTLEGAFENIKAMTALAAKNNIRVILCSVLPSNRFSWKPTIQPADKIIKLNQLLKDFALKSNLVFVDYYPAMVGPDKGLMKKYGEDGTHPNLDGYKVMEGILMKSLQAVLN